MVEGGRLRCGSSAAMSLALWVGKHVRTSFQIGERIKLMMSAAP